MKSRCNTRSLFNTGPNWAAALLCLAVLAWAGAAGAQLPIPASSQFDITGFIEEATLDGPVPASGAAHQGGHIKVNGHVVTVPAETIVIFPANALTWQELFVQAPLPWGTLGTAVNTAAAGGPTSGMAMADCAAGAAGACTAPPLTTWEAQVIGNRVPGAPGGDQYIAGLIYVSQQALNSGSGFINFIDYAAGEMWVGGALNTPAGARVRLNDPAGRYGRPTTSPDIRFTVDPDNPTITAGSGYPMCLPRTAPAGPGVGTDILCPEQNRPLGAAGPVTQFTMNNASNPLFPIVAGFPDSTIQAPFEVGDYITFAGTLVADCATCLGGGTTVGPWPLAGTPATWIAAHTIEANVSILTWQGSNPVYVRTDVTILGTGGLTVLGVGEAAIRTRFEGMMSDLTRAVHLFGMDLDPFTGAVTDRDWGTIGVDPGPPIGAVTGRWRFRPPCLAFGTVPAKPDKQCVMNQAGTFLPPTREVRAVVYDPAAPAPGFANPGFTATAANGLIWGQYHAPILEYIFPENVPGKPIVENNFNTIPFLAQGGYTSSAGTLVKVLDPWPSNVLPAPTCVAPVANPGGPYSVAALGTVTLAGSATGTPAPTFAWTVSAGALSSATIANPVYTAPATAQTVTAALAATNACGTSSNSTTITVTAAAPPTLTAIAPQTVAAGTSVKLQTVATDPANQKLAVNFLQSTGTPPIVFNPNPARVPTGTGFSNSGSTFTSPNFTVSLAQFPAGATSVTLQFSVTATNQPGVTSSAVTTSVTFTAPAAGDVVTITSAEDRTGKQRVIVNATDSVISPTVNLFLNPYQCNVQAAPCKPNAVGIWMYDPAPAAGGVGNQFTNNGGGLYILTAVGAPAPACKPGGAFATPCTATPLTVRSSLGGVSAPSALTKIRQ